MALFLCFFAAVLGGLVTEKITAFFTPQSSGGDDRPRADGDWLLVLESGAWWASSDGDLFSRRSGWEGPINDDPRLDGEVKNLATLPAGVRRRFPTRAWRVKRV